MTSLFSNLLGNPTAKNQLHHMLQHNTLPPVLLFTGPEGVGKKLFAEQLALYLLKTSKKEPPDFHLYRPEGKNPLHTAEEMRALRQQTLLPPFEAPCKVFIIDEAEKMLPASSNALLKTLEEPPLDTYIFLITSAPHLLLPTVISRCSNIPFFPLPDAEVFTFLKQTHKLSPEECAEIGERSSGSLSRASLLAHPDYRFDLEPLFTAPSYPHLLQALSALEKTVEGKEEDEEGRHSRIEVLFEALLYRIRAKEPERLEKALKFFLSAREAIFHHVKLKTVLEQFFF